MKAKIAEIFKSIQGEGLYSGQEQIFIRFFGCNVGQCQFCDTQLSSFWEFEPAELLEYLKYNFFGIYFVSLTGGEPLLQKDFLKEFLPMLKAADFRIYLETNGTLPEALKDIIDYVDIIAMDFKFPSSTGLRNFWQEHEDFLRIALSKEIFVKTVICETTDFADLKRAVEILSEFDKNTPFVLQPNFYENNQALMDKITDFQSHSLRTLSDVRIMPQRHKLMGIK